MTAEEVIENLRSLLPGSDYGEPQLIMWLNELDGDIFTTLYQERENPPVEAWEPYKPNQKPKEVTLLVSGQYADIYVKFLKLKVHLNDSEIEKAENAAMEFNMRYREYRSTYARNHKGNTPRITYL